MSRLDDELRRLVAAGVLTGYQADGLRTAADSDLRDAAGKDQHHPAEHRAPDHEPVLLEVLGYVGGALLLGAVGLLVVVNWDQMGRGQRVGLSLASALVLLTAAIWIRSRTQLASALTAVGACVAGFATYVVVEGTAGRVSGVLVALVLSGLGLWLLRGALLLVSTFAALSALVLVTVFDLIETDGSRTDTAGMVGVGFVLIALVFAVLGRVWDQVTAWSLAGAGVFASAMSWMVQDGGAAMALGIGTAGSIALLAAYGRYRSAAYAVVGCSILLVVWPSGLYQLTENVAAVAAALVVASGALIAAVVMLSGRRPEA